MNSSIDYSDERVLKVIAMSNTRGDASLYCIREIDLSLVNQTNLGEFKMKYDICMANKGYDIRISY